MSNSDSNNEYFLEYGLEKDPFASSYTEETFFTTPELQHRLDLAKHLLEFSQQILFISGSAKVGKTTFSRHLMADCDDEWIFCQIDPSNIIGPDTLVKALLRDSPDEINEPYETISALNSYLVSCHVKSQVPILLLDNIDSIGQDSLRFIFQLKEFKEHETHIRVVLVGQESFLGRLNKVAEEKSNSGLIHAITIPALSSNQTIQYLQHRLSVCGGREDMFSEKEMNRIHKVSAGLPGDINFLARQGLSDPVSLNPDKPTSALPGEFKRKGGQLVKIILAAMLLMAIILLVFSYLRDDTETAKKRIVLEVPPPKQTSEVSPLIEKIKPMKEEALPDAWLESQILVNPQAVEEPVEFADVEPVKFGNSEKKGINEPGATLAPVQTEQTPVVQLAASESEPMTEEMRGIDWLLNQSANNYVLQLIGAVEMATIIRFVEESGLDRSQLAFYKVRKSDGDWHVLAYGLYPDLEQARSAISTLPTKAQGQNPWPKAMSSIHEAVTTP